MPKTPSELIPKTFKLHPNELADLESIRLTLAGRTPGVTYTATDALRHALRSTVLAMLGESLDVLKKKSGRK